MLSTDRASRFRARLSRFGVEWGALLILAIPSLWLLIAVHPFWRDADAYVQVTSGPGLKTLLLFPPLYCFLARVPLFLGYAFDCLAAGRPLPGAGFFQAPILVDHGVFMLVLCQHALLAAAQFFLVRTVARPGLIRALLACALALNAPFYTFAHCVGSEAASLGGLVLYAGLSLRISGKRRIAGCDLLLALLCLTGCILVRHVNAVWACILPIAFLLRIAGLFIRSRLIRKKRRIPRRLFAQWRRSLGWTLLAGILSIAAANGFVRVLCWKMHLVYRSRVGFPFEWRLNFMARIDAAERNRILREYESRTNDPAVKKMLEAIPAGIHTDGRWDQELYDQASRDAVELPAGRKQQDAALDRIRGELARMFLLSFNPAFFSAVRDDFIASWRDSPASIALTPVHTSLYWFRHQDTLVKMAGLNTFRGPDAESRLDAETRWPWFRMIRLPYWFFAGGWVALAVFNRLIGSGKPRRFHYSMALLMAGVLTLFLTLMLTEWEARYLMPLWISLVAVWIIELNGLLSRLADKR